MAVNEEDSAAESTDGSLGISAADVARLARLVEASGLSELRLEEGDLRVTLRTGSYRAAFGAPGAMPTMMLPTVAGMSAPEGAGGAALPGVATAANASAVSVAASTASELRIDAPIMGVFYRSAAPGDPPLVDIGDTVEVGQPVGVIEAMKVFSEVLAEQAGRVRAIPALNGGLVQPGEPLVVLEAL